MAFIAVLHSKVQFDDKFVCVDFEIDFAVFWCELIRFKVEHAET